MSGLSSFFSLFWFLHLRRIATLDSAFFFLACVFPFLFLLSCWRWVVDRWPTMATDAIVLFFFCFFLGRTINGPLSWLMNDCPSTVRPPAGAVDVTVVDVCLFFCHLFGFPDFHRPLFFFRYRRLPTRNRFHSIVFLFSIVGFRFTGVQWNPAIVSVLSLLWFDFVDFDEAFYLAWLAFTGFYEV